MSTILIIEDSAGQRAELRAALEASGLFDHVIEASDGIAGLRLMLSASPDVVLCDLEMPGLDGEKLLHMRRNAAGSLEDAVPFLVLTAVVDLERRAKLLRDGASDTITKPFHAADLIARIALHMKLVQARKELIKRNLELQRISTSDALTGLANRRRLDELLAEEFRRSRRFKVPFSIALGDIDFFKSVNDEYGHPAGDAVLVSIAQAMREFFRATDCGGRFGGEEFLVVLVGSESIGAQTFADRWRQIVEDTKVDLESGESVSVTMSIGIATWTPELDTPERMLRWADEALYRAKASGRNRVCVY